MIKLYKGCIAVVAFFSVITGCATSAYNKSEPYSLTQDKSARYSPTYSSTKASVKNQKISSQTKKVSSTFAPAKIKVSTVSECYHIVKKGETLFSLAKANNMSTQKFAALNNIRNANDLKVGRKLKVSCDKGSSVLVTKKETSLAKKTPNTTKNKVSVHTAVNSRAPALSNIKNSQVAYHVVKRGETLYRIAKQHGLSVDRLKQLNGLTSNEIEVNQRLLLSSATFTIATENQTKSVDGVSSKPIKTAQVSPNKKNKSNTNVTTKTSSVCAKSKLAWQWPTVKGKIIETFSTGEHGNKGIDISDKRGSLIRSAAGGKVVYAGNALRGYGNLIIINHNDDYLSAYAHNDSILVSEGAEVKAGQTIAKMGDTETASVRLHFEIRFRGQSVNPMNYLPAR